MLPSVEFYSAHSCHPLWKISIGTAGQELISPPTQWPAPIDRKIFYNTSHPRVYVLQQIVQQCNLN